MALQIWTDRASHWKATGQVDGAGRMIDATVDDQDGMTRTRGANFSSEENFASWVRDHR